MTLLCGIDEAGRGPVIGPMVMAGVLVEESDLSKLKSIGVKDSKLLTPKKRIQLFDEVIKIVKDYKIIVIQPAEIDAALASEELNLNWLEAIKSTEILNLLNPDTAHIDCPSNNIEAYTLYLREKLENPKMNLKVEHKADLSYVHVGAASILAKVTRDRIIDELKELYGDFGSGYMTDSKTKSFLEKHYKKHKEIFRQGWASFKTASDAKNQKRLGEF